VARCDYGQEPDRDSAISIGRSIGTEQTLSTRTTGPEGHPNISAQTQDCFAIMLLRGYQRKMCNEAKGKNTIVLLPTGAGKTLVGAEIIREKLANEKPTGSVSNKLAVFLVPTRFLVEQQARAVRDWLGETLTVAEFHGDKSFPTDKFDVLVSTPEAFRVQQRSRPDELGWQAISLLLFDEVHHVLKDHPYRKLALALKRFHDAGAAHHVQVVGLTALLTYAVDPRKVELAKNKLCRELGIIAMPSVTKEDLQRDGFHAGSSVLTEIRDQVEIPDLSEMGKVVPENERKPHLMHATFWKRVGDGTATSFACHLVSTIRNLERCVPSFKSPLQQPKLASWGEYASKEAMKSKHRDRKMQLLYLGHWYETLRIVVQSWEEQKGIELAMLFLLMMGADTDIATRTFPTLVEDLLMFMKKYDDFPHFNHLTQELLRQKEKRPSELRALIFVQQKTTCHILSHHLNKDTQIRASGIGSVPLHSTTTASPTPSLSFSTADFKRNLPAFDSGEKSVLVTTTVAEEGMDIGAANCVIRFDPVLTGVSFVQARGRARQEQSAHVIMSQRPGRSADTLQAVEELQSKIASNFVAPTDSVANREKERQAQMSRERGAFAGLKREPQPEESLSILNLFCKKTKASLEEHSDKKTASLTLVYTSSLRTVTAERSGALPFGKAAQKTTKRCAAALLVRQLHEQCSTGGGAQKKPKA
jgi:ERCC4-related helicase